MWGDRIKRLICGLCLMALTSSAYAEIEPGTFPVVGETLTKSQTQTYDKRLSKAVRHLKPQRKGVTDTYVISIALWNDPVFVSEAHQAASILSQRYDADGRTLILTVGSGEALPDGLLAGPETIETALKGVGKIIDPKEDLVVVFVTSHGVDTGEVGLMRRGEETVGAMTPQWLKNQIEDAGIPTRFVIVSACFSGSFVPQFDDMDSAVFTAASADRSSFGCNPERDWTFFGDALFNFQFRGGGDFETAQSSATLLIHAWEMREDVDASQPQRHVGVRAGMRIREAETYGRAIGCVADLWHYGQRDELPEEQRTEATNALTRHTEQARFIGQTRGYTPAQVDAHLEKAKALPDYGNGFKTVKLRAEPCIVQ